MRGLYWYSPPGGAFGRSGAPDRFGLWRGVFFAIEMKADETRSLTAKQEYELLKIRKNGGIAAALFGFQREKLEAIRDEIVRRTPDWIDGS